MKRIKKQVGTDSKAFTIIEVVLVLAVAGLIFLVVFAAIPRLQASRRDNARKDHARAIAALVIEYEANTGSIPLGADFNSAFNSGTGPFFDYIDGQGFEDPSTGSTYSRIPVANTPVAGELTYWETYGCLEGGGMGGGSPVNGSVHIGLERGTFCVGGV